MIDQADVDMLMNYEDHDGLELFLAALEENGIIAAIDYSTETFMKVQAYRAERRAALHPETAKQEQRALHAVSRALRHQNKIVSAYAEPTDTLNEYCVTALQENWLHAREFVVKLYSKSAKVWEN